MNDKPPAGWYADSTGTVRWWDGEQWTEHQPPPPPSASPARNQPDAAPGAGRATTTSAQELREPVGDRQSAVAEAPSRETHDSGSGKGLAMTALGVAVVSLLLCWIPIVNNVVFFLGLIGLVLAVIAYRRARKGKAEGRGMAFAAILISILSVVGVVATQAFYGSILDDVGKAFENATSDSGSGGSEGTAGPDSDSDSEEAAEPSPLPIGEAAEVGSEYTVAVTKVNLNADDVVARTNVFNEPPNGRYIIATLEVTYSGDEEGDPWVDLGSTFVGADARQYDSSACEAVVPDAAMDVPTLNNGGQARFKICYDVPPDAIDGGKIFVEDTMSFDEESRAFWEIR